jgi:hypothetical protein
MENLRSLTAEKVRQYHRQFYRPDNLCLIITGMVSPQKVFEALRPVEDKIVKKGSFISVQRSPCLRACLYYRYWMSFAVDIFQMLSQPPDISIPLSLISFSCCFFFCCASYGRTGALPSMQRPWTNPVPPFSATVEHVVEFPAEDDTTGGMVYFGWRAARAVDYRAKLAHKVLWRAQPFFGFLIFFLRQA